VTARTARLAGRPRLAGEPTRGKTATNRLRRLDAYVVLAHPGVLSAGRPLVVDLGFGARPWTTLELWGRWRALNPALQVVGLDIDPARVDAARAYRHPAVEFRPGGFDVAQALGPARARLVRCANVLRQYDAAAVPGALGLIAGGLEPGGLLIEGTTSPSGHVVAVDVYRREAEGLRHLALVLGTNFRAPIEPGDFQAILPKRLIHRMRGPGPARFFEDWRAALALARRAAPADTPSGRRRRWVVAAGLLRSRFGRPVDGRPRLVRRGYLALADPLEAALPP
jgi:hypothetical protein